MHNTMVSPAYVYREAHRAGSCGGCRAKGAQLSSLQSVKTSGCERSDPHTWQENTQVSEGNSQEGLALQLILEGWREFNELRESEVAGNVRAESPEQDVFWPRWSSGAVMEGEWEQ